jgi:MFS family permease
MDRILKGYTDYCKEVKGFSKNAKLYLVKILFDALNFGIYSVIFNLYILELGYDTTFLGNLLSLEALSIAFFSIPSGIISDRIGRRNSILVSSIFASSFYLILCTNTGKSILLLCEILIGGSFSLFAVSSAPFMVENSTEKERTHLFSVSSALFILGGMVGNFLGGYLPSIFLSFDTITSVMLSYRTALLVSVLFSFLSIVPVYFFIERVKPEKKALKEMLLFRHLESKKIIALLLIPLCLGFFAVGLVGPFFNVIFSRKLGATTSQIGLIFMITQSSAAFTTLLAPVVSKKCGKVKAIVLLRSVVVPLLLYIGFGTQLAFVGIAFFLRSTVANISSPLVSSFSMEVLKEQERATAASFFDSGNHLVYGLANNIAGRIMATGAFEFLFVISSAFYSISALWFYIFFRGHDKPAQPGES